MRGKNVQNADSKRLQKIVSRRLSRRVLVFVGLLVNVAVTLLSGLYATLISDKINSKVPIKDAFVELKWWNFLILIILLLYFLDGFFTGWKEKSILSHKDRWIEQWCKIVAELHRAGTIVDRMRVLVMIYDRRVNKIGTAYSYKAVGDPEPPRMYDLSSLLAGRALESRQVVCENVSEDQKKGRNVWQNLQSLIAAPIYNPNQIAGHPLGVLVIDSNRDKDESKFDLDETRSNIQEVANIFAELLTL